MKKHILPFLLMICAKRGCTETVPYIVLEMVPWLAVWLKATHYLFHIIITFYEEMVVYFRAIAQVSSSDVARLGEITGVCRHGGCLKVWVSCWALNALKGFRL